MISPACIAPFFVLLIFWSASEFSQAQESLEYCLNLIHESKAETEEGSLCLCDAADLPGVRDDVLHKTGELLEDYPHSGWIHLCRGDLLHPNGEADYSEALRVFEGQDDYSGQIRARVKLAVFPYGFRPYDRADAQLKKARRLFEEHQLGSLDEADLLTGEARLLMMKPSDLDAAHWKLLRAWQLLREDESAPFRPKRECLRSLALVTSGLGLNRESLMHAREAVKISRAHGNILEEASGLYDFARTVKILEVPDEVSIPLVHTKLLEALSLAEESGHARIEALTRRLIAEMEGGPKAKEHWDKCIELAIGIPDADLQRVCLLAQARNRLKDDKGKARRLFEEAGELELQSEDPWASLYSWDDYLSVIWSLKAQSDAMSDALAVLDRIEDFRHRQQGISRDRFLSAWSDAYYWLAGRLLMDAPDRDSIERAFQVIERLRAQALREAVVPVLPAPESQTPLLEIPLDLLDRVERRLTPDEAMLSFQIALWRGYDDRFAGGAWVTVVTSRGSRVYPLETDWAKLKTMLGMYLVERDYDNPEHVAELYDLLLRPILSDLPGKIRRLILVLDGRLHLVPFSLLRPGSNTPPLIGRFELSAAPSANLWLHWKESAGMRRTRPASALVLANPSLKDTAASSEKRLNDALKARLGRLPDAKREGERVIKHIRGQSLMASRRAASEGFFKTRDFRLYNILHFAAHAISDEERPWRSAIVLAGGGDAEDGLLHPSEIGELKNLDGKLVVLASCHSAFGEVLRGEGVLSLSRAFLEAGAHVVIGSLWPLNDRESMRFFDAFYERLSQGLSVGRSLAETQREWIDKGEPASNWAGIVALGNSDLVPVPGGLPEPSTIPRAGSTFFICVLVAALFFRLLRRSFQLSIGWRRGSQLPYISFQKKTS